MVILTLIVTFFLGCFICINTDMMRSSKTTPDATPITVLWVLLIWWKKPLDFFSVRDDHKDQRKHKMKNEHFSTQIRITIELIVFIFIITLLHNQGSWCSILHNNPLTPASKPSQNNNSAYRNIECFIYNIKWVNIRSLRSNPWRRDKYSYGFLKKAFTFY